MTGPPILNDLTSILVRFRCHQYAITADIEKAFLHINLDPEDRDATRFFWLSDSNDPDSNFDVYRFKSVLFGASSSPFILNATLKKHLDQFDDPVATQMKTDIYVDNLVSGVDTQNDALQYFHQARHLMSPVGFNLRTWTSNSPNVRSLTAQQGLQDKDAETKVLGLHWNPTTDTLTYQQNKSITPENNLTTKRDILRQSSKIYDPLGFLTPVTIRAKILLQDLWQRQFNWDEPLPNGQHFPRS